MKRLTEAFLLKQPGTVSLVGAGGKTTLMFHLARVLGATGDKVLTTTTTKIFPPLSNQSSHLIVAADADEVLQKARRVLPASRHITAARAYLVDRGKLDGFAPEAIDTIGHSRLFDWILVEADGARRRPLKVPAAHEPVIANSTRYCIAVAGLDAVGHPLDARWVFRPDLYSRLSGLAPGRAITVQSIARVLLHPEGVLRGCAPGAKRLVFLNKADDDARRRTARALATLLCQHGVGRLDRVLFGSLRTQALIHDWMDLPQGGGT